MMNYRLAQCLKIAAGLLLGCLGNMLHADETPLPLAWEDQSLRITTSSGTPAMTGGAYGDGRFVHTASRPNNSRGPRVFVGDYDTVPLVESSGTTGYSITSPTNFDASDIAFGNGLFVMVANNGRILTSPSGLNGTWTTRTSGTTRHLTFARHVNGLFVVGVARTTGAAASVPTALLTSADGIAWTLREYATTDLANSPSVRAEFTGVVHDGTAYYLTASNLSGTNSGTAPRIYRGVNLDGPFTGQGTLVTNSNFRGIAFGAGTYVAVGSNHIYSSPDGLAWTRRAEALTPSFLNQVAWADGAFVVVGDGGLILTSANGTDWVAVASPTAINLNKLYHGDGAWFAGGPSMTLVSSGPALNLAAVELVSSPESTIVPAGGDTTFSVVFGGNPAPAIEWLFNPGSGLVVLADGVTAEGMIVSGATTGELVLQNIPLAYSGATFFARASGIGGTRNSLVATMGVPYQQGGLLFEFVDATQAYRVATDGRVLVDGSTASIDAAHLKTLPTIGTWVGGLNSAFDMNAAGTLALVNRNDFSVPGGQWSALFEPATGVYTNLAPPDGYTDLYLETISENADHGAGFAEMPDPENPFDRIRYAVRRNPDGSLTQLGALAGRTADRATGISADGTVISGYVLPKNFPASLPALPYVWYETTGIQQLPLPPTATVSGDVRNISRNAEWITGFTRATFNRATRWRDTAGTWSAELLDLTAPYVTSDAWTVNNSGLVAGYSSISSNFTNYRATVWLPDRTPVVLAELLKDEYGLDLVALGWNLSIAFDITDDGHWICGYATRTVGTTQRAWRMRLATPLADGPVEPPPPASGYALWAAGLPAHQQGPDATPAGDGVTNLMKYALGVPPLGDASGNLPSLEAFVEIEGASYLTLSYIRSTTADDIVIEVQVSTELPLGENLGSVVLATADLGGGLEKVTVRSAVRIDSHQRQFMRLNVTRVTE